MNVNKYSSTEINSLSSRDTFHHYKQDSQLYVIKDASDIEIF